MKKAFALIEFMVTVAILSILAGMISGAMYAKSRRESDLTAPMAVRKSGRASFIEEYEYRGHSYLFHYRSSIVHAEHCQCKTNHVVTAGSYVVLPEASQIDPKQLPPMWDHFGNRIVFDAPKEWGYSNVFYRIVTTSTETNQPPAWDFNGRKFEGTYTNPFQIKEAK